MDIIADYSEVWAATITDEPGSLSQLLMGLRDAGADIDFILARRSHEKPGVGVVFVTPIRGDREISAAVQLGFNITSSIHSVRIEGDNFPGVAAKIAERLATARIDVSGLSAAVLGTRFVTYIGLKSAGDAEKAIAILRQAWKPTK